MSTWVYNLKKENGSWLAYVSITNDGFIGIVSDWGNAAFQFMAFGGGDFRNFILNIGPDYLGQKFANNHAYMNGKGTRVGDKYCIQLAETVLPALKVAIRDEKNIEATRCYPIQ